MNLASVRQKIDQIDRRILALIKERIELLPEIVEYKRRHNLEIFQKSREDAIFDKLKQIARELNLNYEMVEKIWRNLIKESHRVENLLLRESTIPSSDFQFDFSKLKVRRKRLNLKISLFEIFQSIYANFDRFYFLESLEEDQELSRKSYIGFEPLHIFSAQNDVFFIDGKPQKITNPLAELKKVFPSDLLEPSGEFRGGLIGYFGYEAWKYQENLPYFKQSEAWPDFEFGLYLDGLVYDKLTGELEYYYLDTDRSDLITNVLEQSFDLAPLQVEKKAENMSDEAYRQGVEKVKKHIVNGDIFQGVLSKRFDYQVKGATLDFYKRLREINPSPHMFFVKFDQRELIGSSPELVARVEKGLIETFPIAGTRSRGQSVAEDQQIAQELLDDTKEKAEHLMLVDMARNDLGRICEYGSVEVAKLMYIKKYSHVQHIVSNVQGKLRADVNLIDAVLTQMPMGTVSGSPRLEAIKILNDLEPTVRGPYGGAVGFLSFSREAIFALMIRSFFVNGDEAYAQAGAGVVSDSNPEYELKEVQKKVRVVHEALGD